MNTVKKTVAGIATAVGLAVTAPAAVYYVTPTGGGDGSSWNSAMTLAAGLEAVTGGGELWLKKGTYTFSEAPAAFAPTAEVVIRGGFDGESAAADRAVGAKSTLDGENTYDAFVLANTAAVTIERVVFTRGHAHGLDKSGAGNLTLVDCEINSNGRTLVNKGGTNYGRGLYFHGTTAAALVVSNCTFAGNVVGDSDFSGSNAAAHEFGTAMYVTTCKNILLTDSTFVTNGIPFDKSATTKFGTGNSNRYQGAVIYDDLVPMTVERCKFIANRCSSVNSSSYAQGAIVYSRPPNGKENIFRHCLFAGNEILGPSASGMATVLYCSSYQGKTTIDTCTFAYNLARSGIATAVYSESGATKISNSVFFGNIGLANSSVPRDFSRKGGNNDSGRADYSLFSALTSDGITSTITQGEGLVAGDPLFETTTDEFLALIENDSPAADWMDCPFRFKPEKVAEVANLDLHLRSSKGYVDNAGVPHVAAGQRSPGIDAGDPTRTDWTNEPGDNGGRLNAGVYAGTSEASQTPKPGQPEVSDGDLVISFVGGYTQPQIDFALGGEGQTYLATVRILCGTGTLAQAGTTYGWTNDLSNVANGDPVTWKLPAYLRPGDEVCYRVVVEAEGAETRTANAHKTVEGEYPAWAGKGGGPTVMHVRVGATGDANGSDWANAYSDLGAALLAWSGAAGAGKTEIWVSSGMPLTAETLAATYSVSRSAVIRGGFSGCENTLAERPAEAVTVLDGEGTMPGMKLSVSAPLTLERFVFRRLTGRGLTVDAGSSTFTLDSCRLEDNIKGLEATLTSGGSGRLFVTNCVFAGHVLNAANPGSCSGRALSVTGGNRVTIDDTLFVSNGVDAAYAATLSENAGDSGVALFLRNTTVTARNTKFIGNRLRRSYAGNGGICKIEYYQMSPFPTAGSAFTNCLWIGNEECDGGDRFKSGGGMVLVPQNQSATTTSAGRFDFVNCTFAYNISGGQPSQVATAAGLNFYTGDVFARNCIFYGNMIRSGIPCGSDIYVSGAAASVDVDYTLFAGKGTDYVSGSNVTIGDHNVYDRARMVTTDAQFLACVEKDGTGSVSRFSDAKSRLRFDTNEVSAVSTFNAHLRGRAYVDETTGTRVEMSGRSSPAVDAGDPAMKCVEPKPNGRRVNLGFYGNTPYATISKGGTMILVR